MITAVHTLTFDSCLSRVLFACRCIFLPNNGGFFISYVTFCAFIGTAVELLRLPALLGYVVALKRAKTKHEKEQAKKVRACTRLFLGAFLGLNILNYLCMHCTGSNFVFVAGPVVLTAL